MASVISLGRAVVQVYGDWSRFDSGAAAASRGLMKNLSHIGRAMTYSVTLPAGVAAASMLSVASDFEYAMDRAAILASRTGEIVGSDLDRLSEKAQALGLSTVFTATEAAQGMQFLAQAGLEVDDILVAIGPSLDLAAAGELDLARSADIATNVMSAFGLEAGDMGHISDVLAATMSTSNTSVEQMATALEYVGPVARFAGISLEETSAAIGLLGNSGLQAGKAGTGLRNIMMRLAAPTKAVKKTLEGLGIEIYNTDGSMQSLESIFRQFGDAGLGIEDVFNIFKQRGTPAFAAIEGEGVPALSDFADALAEVNVEGRAAGIAAAQLDNFKGSTMLLKAAFEGLAISVSESGLSDYVRDLMDRFRYFIIGVSEAPPQFLAFATAVIGVVAAIGPLFWLTGTLVSLWGAALAVLPALAGAFLVATGVFLAGKYVLDEIKDSFADAMENSTMFRWNWHRMGVAFGEVTAEMQRVWDILVTRFNDADTVTEGLENVWSALKLNPEALLGPLREAFETAWDSVVEWMSEGGWEMLLGAFLSGKTKVMEVATSILDWITEGLVENRQAIIDWVTNDFLPTFISIVGSSTISFAEAAGTLVGALADSFISILTGNTEMGDAVREKISNITDEVTGTLGDLFGAFQGGDGGETGDMFGGVMESLEPLINFLDTVGRSVMEWFSETWEMLQPRLEGIGSEFGKLWDSLQPVFAFLGVVAPPILGFLAEMFGTALRNAIDGVLQVIQYLTMTLRGIIDFIVGIFTGNWSKAWDGIKAIFTGTVGAIIGALRVWFEVGILRIFSKAFAVVRGIVSGGWAFIKGLFTSGGGSIIQTVSGFVASVANFFRSGFTRIVKFVVGRLGNIYLAIANTLSRARAFVSGIMSGIRRLFSAAFNKVKSITLEGIGAVWRGIVNTLTRIVKTFRSALTSIWRNVRQVFSDLRIDISDALRAVGRFIRDAWRSFKSIFTNGFSGIRSGMTNFANGIRQAWRTLVSTVTGIVDTMVSSIRGAWRGITNSVSAIMGSIPSSIFGIFRSAKTKVMNVFRNAGDWLKDAGGKILSGLIDGIQSKITSVTDTVTGVAASVREFFPFSPAKRGPLKKYPMDRAGKNVASMLAGGLKAGQPELRSEISAMAGMFASMQPESLIDWNQIPSTRPAPGQGGQRAAMAAAAAAASSRRNAGTTREINNHFYGPQTGNEIMREIDWSMRFG